MLQYIYRLPFYISLTWTGPLPASVACRLSTSTGASEANAPTRTSRRATPSGRTPSLRSTHSLGRRDNDDDDDLFFKQTSEGALEMTVTLDIGDGVECRCEQSVQARGQHG